MVKENTNISRILRTELVCICRKSKVLIVVPHGINGKRGGQQERLEDAITFITVSPGRNPECCALSCVYVKCGRNS